MNAWPGALPTRLGTVRPSVLAAAVAVPLLAVAARLVPADGVGLAVRLAVGSACVLLLPGGLVLRALAWPREPGLAIAGSFVLSLAIAFGALVLTFALDGTLWLTVALVGAAAAAAAVPAARASAPGTPRGFGLALAGVGAASLAFAAILWWATETLGTGDALFHVARARKLAEADALTSVAVANEFRDGGLHPGYAFPLWHGVLAAIAQLAGVDVAVATLHLSAVLVPIAFAVAYAGGAALLGSWAGGVAVLAAYVGQLGFSRGVTGSFASLALPASQTRLVLVPALLALALAFVRAGDRRILLPLAAAALAVAVVHPTYLVFVALALGGFALLWLAASPRPRADGGRVVLAAAAVLAPAVAFFLWLLPIVTSTASYQPAVDEERRALAHYGDQLDRVAEGYRAAPDVVTRAGPVVVAGLAVLPLLALWTRRIWAAFAVGASLVVLAVLLVPDLFTRLSDLVSISQSRRLAQFLPVPFAVAAAAVLAGRMRAAGVALALAAGIALELLYTAEGTHAVREGGPVWPVWLACLGTPIALVAALVLRRRISAAVEPTAWAAAAALAFVVPVAVGGVAAFDRRDDPDAEALTPGLVTALAELRPGEVVFAPVGTAYRAAAVAPVYVAATPPPHAADTEENRPYARQRDVIRFFAPRSGLSTAERRALLERYGADAVIVDKTRAYPRRFLASFPVVYEDGRYALLRVDET